MGKRKAVSGNSTAAVLWLMILLVFLPIAVAHVVARQGADAPGHTGAAQQQASSRAG